MYRKGRHVPRREILRAERSRRVRRALAMVNRHRGPGRSESIRVRFKILDWGLVLG